MTEAQSVGLQHVLLNGYKHTKRPRRPRQPFVDSRWQRQNQHGMQALQNQETQGEVITMNLLGSVAARGLTSGFPVV